MSTYICWPEKKWLSDEAVEAMFLDAVENGYVPMPLGEDAKTVEGMVSVLEDIGQITRGKEPS